MPITDESLRIKLATETLANIFSNASAVNKTKVESIKNLMITLITAMPGEDYDESISAIKCIDSLFNKAEITSKQEGSQILGVVTELLDQYLS